MTSNSVEQNVFSFKINCNVSCFGAISHFLLLCYFKNSITLQNENKTALKVFISAYQMT